MQLQLRSFDRIVAAGAAAVQGAAQQALDLSVGSVLRAILEANAGLGLWLQWLVLLVLQTTRAATSSAGDLDTWVADFGLSRLPASVATGAVTFARFAPVSSALIRVGTIVRTADSNRNFAVSLDPANAAWTAAQNGYLLAAGVASLTVPVTAATAGSAGNVQAGTISLIAAAIPGVDTVNNPTPTAGGLDAESDDALRMRFAGYINTRSRATTQAIGNAIASVQQGLQYTIQENVSQSGAPQPGCFVVTVDDGTGAPSAALLSQVATAIEAVRPLGVIWTVVAPVVTTASVSLAIATASGTSHSATAAIVAAAIAAYIDALPVGAVLPWSRLAQIAYDTSPAVTNVGSVLLNGGSADVVPTANGVVKAGTVVVT
jgi:uncharacterized phage protein gp47/JayE